MEVNLPAPRHQSGVSRGDSTPAASRAERHDRRRIRDQRQDGSPSAESSRPPIPVQPSPVAIVGGVVTIEGLRSLATPPATSATPAAQLLAPSVSTATGFRHSLCLRNWRSPPPDRPRLAGELEAAPTPRSLALLDPHIRPTLGSIP